MFRKKPAVIDVHMPTRTEYVTREVHEHRAPTDDSVRLLREMEDKARQQVEQSINVGGNDFECVVNIEVESMSMDTVAVALFRLNGKQMRSKARVEGWQQKDDVLPLTERLRDAVAKTIATEIVGPAFSKAWKQ